MKDWLSAGRARPDDHARAELVGRVWRAETGGPTLVRVKDGFLEDVSSIAPTSSQLLNLDDPVAAASSKSRREETRRKPKGCARRSRR